MACPDEVAIDAVLSRTAAARLDGEVRAHVATCEACLARWGASFELELWGGVLDGAPRASKRPRMLPLLRLQRRRAVLAAAAAAVLVAGALLAWPYERRSEPQVEDEAANRIERNEPIERIDQIEVVELTMVYGVSGPNGSWRVKTELLRGSPMRYLVIETKVGVDGVVTRHDRTELLPAATKEKGP